MKEDQTVKETVQLPLSFANHHGIVIAQYQGEEKLLCRSNYNVMALQEVHRTITKDYPVVEVDDETFSKVLEYTFSQHSEASEMIADSLEDETMNFEDIAHALDEPDDLLSSEDDAPIIKLLNSLFFEAIQKKASDIHVEPL